MTSPDGRPTPLIIHPWSRGPFSELMVAVALAALATLLRWWLGLQTAGILPYAIYFPAILVAALLCGWRAGLAALAMSAVAGWYLFGRPAPGFGLASAVNLAIFVVSMAAVFASTTYTRALVERLRLSEQIAAKRNLLNDTLFATMSEGFALCEAICDGDGQLVDYVIREMNPALRETLTVGPEVIGSKLSDGPRDQLGDWLRLCDRVLRTGGPARWEYHNVRTGRWHDIRIGRVADGLLAQFFFDITERKRAESRQAELFDELNHRVKNNLSLVSSFLQLQARSASPKSREELTKAVVRVESIARVHSALYRGGRREDVDLGGYIGDLCSGLAASLGDDGRVDVRVDAEPVAVGVDAAVALGMVVTELVTNAAKYAYPTRSAGQIIVTLRRDVGALVLSVGDRGVGLGGEIDGRREGLGLRLVKSLVSQVSGELTIHGPPGATFEIRVPT